MRVKADDIHFKEWEACRKVISEFDERIHDIRKYGFSFITALIAAEAILIPRSEYISSGDVGIPDNVKFAVFCVTFLLIIIVCLMERYYKLYIKCSAQRARILERSLNLELTEIISDRHRKRHIPLIINLIYIGFILGVGFLGYFILGSENEWIEELAFGTLLALGSIIIIQYPDLKYQRGTMDWTIEPIECFQGEKVRITVTNVAEKIKSEPLKLGPGEVWRIETQDGVKIDNKDIEKNSIILIPKQNYTWEWDTKGVESNTYKLIIHYKDKKQKDKEHTLRRKIIVKPENGGIKEAKIKKKLGELKDMRDQGLISEQDYEEKKKEILKEL